MTGTRAHPAPKRDSWTASSEYDSWRPWILVGLGLLGVGLASWRPVPAGVWHDDGVYMLLGKSLAEGHGLVYHGVAGTPPATKFPPGYPLVLGALWSLTRSIGAVTLLATLLNLGLIAAAGALFGRTLHRAVGLPVSVSVITAVMGFASTDVVRTALIPLSEPLFVLLVVLTLAQWPKVAAAVESKETPDGSRSPGALGPNWPLLVPPALTLVAVVATRSAGFAVLLACVAGLLLPRPSTRRLVSAALLTGPAFFFLIAWGRWSNSATERIPEGARDLLGPYQGWLAEQVSSGAAGFVADLPGHVTGVIGRAIALLLPGLVGTPLWVLGGLLLTLAAIGTVVLIRRLPACGWLIVTYLAMLMVWPYLDRRLLVPLHPLLVSAIATGGLTLIDRSPSRMFRRVVPGLALLWLLGYASVSAYRVADGEPSAPYRVRSRQLAAAVEAMDRTVPDDGVVGAPEAWAALHLHGGWVTAPSVRFDPRSEDPEAPMWGTAEEQLALWRDTGINHLLLEQGGQLHGEALDRLETECPGAVAILARMRVALVVRLDWTATCPGVLPSTPRWP